MIKLYIMIKKTLIICFIFLFCWSFNCLADDIEGEVANIEETTTTTIVHQEIGSLPLGFRINRFLLGIRKIITRDPVEKLNIDVEILNQESKIIDRINQNEKTELRKEMLESYLNRQELIMSKIEKIDEKEERLLEIIEKIKNVPEFLEEKKEEILNRMEAQQERIRQRKEIQEEFKQNMGEIKEQRQEIIQERKQEQQGIINQFKEQMQNKEENGDGFAKPNIKESLIELKEMTLEKLKSLNQQRQKVVEEHKENIQNIQKPAKPILQIQQSMEEVDSQVSQ